MRLVLLELFCGTPTPGNVRAEKRFAADVYRVTRQLRCSNDKTPLAQNLCLFINGLPTAAGTVICSLFDGYLIGRQVFACISRPAGADTQYIECLSIDPI